MLLAVSAVWFLLMEKFIIHTIRYALASPYLEMCYGQNNVRRSFPRGSTLMCRPQQ